MKRFLKKSLIYLLAFTIAIPAWFATGITSAQHAHAAAVEENAVVLNEIVNPAAPVVTINFPETGAHVSGEIDIKGTITDENPDHYWFQITAENNIDPQVAVYREENQSVTSERVFKWKTAAKDDLGSPVYPDGVYTLQLEARDKDDLKDPIISIDPVTVTVDNTKPVITVNPDSVPTTALDQYEMSLVAKGSEYVDHGAKAFDAIDTNIKLNPTVYEKFNIAEDGSLGDITILPNGIDTSVSGYYAAVYSATDQAKNTGYALRMIFVTDYMAVDSNGNTTFDFSNDFVDGSVTADTDLNLPLSDQSGIIGSVYIPAGTKISGAGWSGILNAPRIVDLGSVALTLDQNNIPTDTMAFEVGAGATPITFDAPVKITIFGAASKRVGYVKDGKFVEITAKCGVDENGKLIMPDATTNECKTVSADGKDLIVLTKHFTTFVTYSQAELKTPAFTVTSVPKADGNYIQVNWTGLGGGVDYEIFINGDSKTVINAKADIAGKTYSQEFKVDYGTYSVTLKTKVGTIYSSSTAKQLTIVKPEVVAPVVVTPNVAPTKAKAATPAAEVAPKVDDSKGVIKGDETNKDEKESINWTPWIILFVLIVLAGAATGGYFYWFAGKEDLPVELKKVEKKEIQKEIKKEDITVTVKSKKDPKKTKRW
jgi:hypothetical protein